MALEDIISKINQDAEDEAESILSLARAEADSILEKARRQADEARAKLMKEAENRADNQAKRIETLAGLEQRKELLREKKKLIDEAFERAVEKVKNLPPKEYLAFMKPLILSAVESGREEIIPSSQHRQLFTPEFLKKLNSELGPGRGHLRLSEETGDFSAGFILREGNKETNLTLESIIKSQRESLEPTVANTLFGEQK